MTNGNAKLKTHIVVDLGPSTVLIISQIILLTLKIMNYIQFSWTLILSPIIMVIGIAVVVLFFTLLQVIKDNLF